MVVKESYMSRVVKEYFDLNGGEVSPEHRLEDVDETVGSFDLFSLLGRGFNGSGIKSAGLNHYFNGTYLKPIGQSLFLEVANVLGEDPREYFRDRGIIGMNEEFSDYREKNMSIEIPKLKVKDLDTIVNLLAGAEHQS